MASVVLAIMVVTAARLADSKQAYDSIAFTSDGPDALDAVAVTLSLAWLALALVALGVEAVVANLIFLFISVAALLAADIAALGGTLTAQIPAFALTGVLLPALLRPRLLEKLSGRGVMSRTEALLGETAKVTEHIDPVLGSGRVVVNGQDWAARCSSVVPPGNIVRIVGADGIVLLVTPLAIPGPSLPPT